MKSLSRWMVVFAIALIVVGLEVYWLHPIIVRNAKTEVTVTVKDEGNYMWFTSTPEIQDLAKALRHYRGKEKFTLEYDGEGKWFASDPNIQHELNAMQQKTPPGTNSDKGDENDKTK